MTHTRFTAQALMILVLAAGGRPAAAQQPNTPEPPSIGAAVRSGDADAVQLWLGKMPSRREKNQTLLEAVRGGLVVVVMEDVPPQPATSVSNAAAPPDSPYVKIVKLLLENGANIEARDTERSTPLLIAAAYGQTDVFIALLQRGADLHARDKFGNTALIAAACECAVATMNSTYDIVKILIEKGSDPNAHNLEGTTALMNAAGGFGDAAIVRLLLESGADPTLKDKHGNTALAYARKSQRPDKVKLLKRALAGAH